MFQYLVQGTSLRRDSLARNADLKDQLHLQPKPHNPSLNDTGKFSPSDSEDDDDFHAASKAMLKLLRLKVTGQQIPPLCTNFTKLFKRYSIPSSIGEGICRLGYHKPTPVQMQVFPCLMQKRHCLVTAPTGTGKTLAFLLPIVASAKTNKKLQCVIIAPTQELGAQIYANLTDLIAGAEVTGQLICHLNEQQDAKIKKDKPFGVNILVSTPMAFLHKFKGSPTILQTVETVILDECDKYFEQSFLEQVRQILEMFNNSDPTFGLFSATIQHAVEQLMRESFLDRCIRIQIGGKNQVLKKIDQSMEYCTNEYGKIVYLKNLIQQGSFVPPVLIFVQEKQRAKQLLYEIKKVFATTSHDAYGKVQIVSSDKGKEERQAIIDDFDKGRYWALITTDMVARGIDFKGVNLVINYDFPTSMLTYIHRVGRTGRADRKGRAITLFTDEDKPLVRSLANLMKSSGCQVPEWLLTLPKADRWLIKKIEKHPVKRLPVGVANMPERERHHRKTEGQAKGEGPMLEED